MAEDLKTNIDSQAIKDAIEQAANFEVGSETAEVSTSEVGLGTPGVIEMPNALAVAQVEKLARERALAHPSEDERQLRAMLGKPGSEESAADDTPRRAPRWRPEPVGEVTVPHAPQLKALAESVHAQLREIERRVTADIYTLYESNPDYFTSLSADETLALADELGSLHRATQLNERAVQHDQRLVHDLQTGLDSRQAVSVEELFDGDVDRWLDGLPAIMSQESATDLLQRWTAIDNQAFDNPPRDVMRRRLVLIQEALDARRTTLVESQRGTDTFVAGFARGAEGMST